MKGFALMKNKNKWYQLISIVALSVFGLAACGNAGTNPNAKGDVNLSYVEWDTEVASTHVIGQVIEDLGYNVELTPLDNAIMWESLSKGEVDAMVSAWLPNTHAEQFETYKDQIDPLGVNLPSARIGLVVPTYMDVDSIADLDKQAKQTIIGIEPGAGIVVTTEKALEEYANLADWTMDTASSAVMTIALEQAIKNKEEIVVTGWSPHWKFEKFDLKYLDDPQGVYGESETINTMARLGLKEDMPEVYSVLEKFEWSQEDMQTMLVKIQRGEDPKAAAKDFIADNPDLVKSWTE